MLFGMAALKAGFFTRRLGDRRATARSPLIGFGIAHPRLCPARLAAGPRRFRLPDDLRALLAATTPFRPVMVVGYRRPDHPPDPPRRRPGRPDRRRRPRRLHQLSRHLDPDDDFLLRLRRSAFTARSSRIELWLVVIAMWALMLLWSKPWLDRFRYGPFEWLWRSLARCASSRCAGAAAGRLVVVERARQAAAPTWFSSGQQDDVSSR